MGGGTTEHNNVFTKVEFTLADGEPIPQDKKFGMWEKFRMYVELKDNSGNVKEGHTSLLNLPEEVQLADTNPIEIMGEGADSDKKIADVALIKKLKWDDFTVLQKAIKLTYTDYPESKTDFKAKIFFYVYVEPWNKYQETDLNVNYVNEGTPLFNGVIRYKGNRLPEKRLFKKVGRNGVKPGYMTYDISVNQLEEDLKNVVITDRLQSNGIQIESDGFRITKGTWIEGIGDYTFKKSTEQNVTGNYTVEYDTDRKGFKINFGDIAPTDGFMIQYHAKISGDPVDGERYRNDAQMTADGKPVIKFPTEAPYNMGSGTGIGYDNTLRIVKKEKGTGTLLSGAKFKMIRTESGNSIGEYTTNTSGEIVISKLPKAEYEIVEVEAPEGYMIDKTAIRVEKTDFDAGNLAIKEIENDKVEKITIPFLIEWRGGEGASATVRLTANGKPVGSPKIVTASTWTGNFTNLPKYDRKGNEITYDMTQDAVGGYTTDKSRKDSADITQGFVFVNTKIPTVDKIHIPVEIKWVGGEESQVTVRLKANNIEKDRKNINKDTDHWKKSFTDLPKTDLSGDIVYTVEQDTLANYTTEVKKVKEDDITKGFIITNTKKTSGGYYVPETPDDTPSGKPEETPSDKPEERPSETPSDKPEDKSEDKPVNTPGDEPENTPKESPEEIPVIPTEIPRGEFSNEIPEIEEVITSEVPDIPEISRVTIAEEEDLEIEDGLTPRGDTDIEVNEDPNSKGRILAKTGGLVNHLIPIIGILGILLCGLLILNMNIIKKKK